MLSGCAGGKIFEPYDADKTSVSMDARQRVILSVDRIGPDGVKRRIVCAEPSPDTIAAAAASADLSGGVSGNRRRRRSRPTSRAMPPARSRRPTSAPATPPSSSCATASTAPAKPT